MSRQQALFSSGGGNRSSNASKALVEFRAGKMSMSGTLVSPDKRKGMVMVEQGIILNHLLDSWMNSIYLLISQKNLTFLN